MRIPLLNKLKNIANMGDTVSDVAKAGADVAKSFNGKEQASQRHQTDMLSDNKLSKNIRPVVVIWAIIMYSALIIANICGVDIDQSHRDTLFYVLMLSVGFYFPSRTLEKFLKKGKA